MRPLVLDFAVAVAVAVAVVAGLKVGRRGWLLRRVVRVGRRHCLWVALPGRRRASVLSRMGFAVLRAVKVGQKQIEKARRTGSLVAEGRCLMRLQRDLIAAESVRLLLWRRD